MCPGLASGCPLKANAGLSLKIIPCKLSSKSEIWLGSIFVGKLDKSTAKP